MSKETLIADVTVFDGTGFVPGVSVLFDDEKIIGVGADLDAGPDCRVIDGVGKTLLPGLIDAHVHTPSIPTFAEGVLRKAVVFGVTTVIDLGAEPSVVTAMKAKAAVSSEVAGLVSAGVVATAPGGHPLELGGELPTLSRPEEAASFVAARVAEGSDFLKIVLEDGTTYGIESPTLDYPVVEALTKAAHEAGLLVVAHAAGQDFARWAIQAGVDVLAHAVVDEAPAADVVSALASSGTAVMSTLTVFEAAERHRLWRDPRVAAYLEPAYLERLGEYVAPEHRPNTQIEFGLRAIRAYHGAGVSILAAATSRPADVFSLHDRGRIAAGLRPDLVLVDGDVEQDISRTLDVRHVWRHGVEVKRVRNESDLQDG
ncbi:MAG: amidohydrolase family protein [Chloroflexota bacterium]|nr:amidohydrolase family protein [Chloroflexota bacterium]